MTTTRESSTETADRYTFGYTTELSSNHESSLCTAKRLRQRLQRQQSGQSGRRYTGESSECSSLVGTPTESGRCFTFTAAQRILRNEERKPSVNQNISEMLLDAIHLDDVNLVDRILVSHSSNKVLSTSPSIGSTNTFTDLAQRRHGATNNHRRSNASSTVSTHSGGRSNCAVVNTLHMAVAHKQREIVELLLKSGYDPNIIAQCHCKGGCITSGNITLSSMLPRTHSTMPEICSICSHLRVVSIIDQSPLGVAVRAQSSEMIALLVSYGADVNAADEDGNTPLMLAVRESPLSWHCLHMLIMFGARIMQKNTRSICPLDLAPELRKLQETCVENLFQTACMPSAPTSLMAAAAAVAAATTGNPSNSANLDDGGGISQSGSYGQERVQKTGSMISATKHFKKFHIDAESLLLPASFCERSSLSKAPLSPRTSTAPSVSTCSMMENLSVNKDKDGIRRKSFVSLQLHRRSKIQKESPFFDGIGWEQAWEMLQKMAGNPECIEFIIRCLHKASSQMEESILSMEKDIMDSHLGGLLHQILLTSIGEYQQSTPTYQRANKKRLVGILVSLVNFCYLCLQKSGSCRQFAALNTLNKIIDAALVNSLFVMPEVHFYSSRLLNRTHEFHSCEFDDAYESPTMESHQPVIGGNFPTRSIATHIFDTSGRRRETNESTSAPALILHSFYRKHGVNTNTHTVKIGDLLKAFSSLQPATVIACLHNAITMQNREAGSRSVCSPAHRWRQCHFHCSQILAARFLLFLTSFKEFRHHLSDRSQLKTLVQLLEPTHDPQLLCLLLQTIAIIALDPATTDHLIEIQIDDALIQMLLPADDWYYTNHSTKFGHFVKHHAARILVYIGLGDRVGNRVNLFQPIESLSLNSDARKSNDNSPNEDEYIYDTLRTANITQEFSKTAMSAEGVLQKILSDLSKNAIVTASEPITEESPSAILSPAIHKTLISPTGCIIEECEDNRETPSPSALSLSQRPATPHNLIPKTSTSEQPSTNQILLTVGVLQENTVTPQETPTDISSIDDNNKPIEQPSQTRTLQHRTTQPTLSVPGIRSRRASETGGIITSQTIEAIGLPKANGISNQIQSDITIGTKLGNNNDVPKSKLSNACNNNNNNQFLTPTAKIATNNGQLQQTQQQQQQQQLQQQQAQQQNLINTETSPRGSLTCAELMPTLNEFAALSPEQKISLAAVASHCVSTTGLNLSNLESHLWKFSMILDSMLLLRLLLHKISWDLSLVAKKRLLASQDSHRSVTSGSGHGGTNSNGAHNSNMNENRAYSSCSLGNSFYSRNFGKSKSFDRREDHSIKSKDKRFLRVDQGSRLSKRVHIRRSSSVEIPRPKRFSSGAKELRKERRKRLGTDTSSGSSKSKKTNSSTSSVQKHLPKYIQSLFRGRMGTDPCKRHTRGDSSPDSNTSGSEAVLEFTKKLQNIPMGRRETMRQAYKNSGHQDSSGTNSEQRAKSMGYSYLPEVEVNGASPPRSPVPPNGDQTSRRPSSPQAIPGLPLIEIRRPSALSQFEFGYFVNSPEIIGGNGLTDSDCAPLLLSGNGAQNCSRKSSDESSMCGWSSRASSAMSQRSSSGGLRLSTFSAGTSIASDNSGPFLFSFVLRKRASTIGTRIPLSKRAISRSSGDSLRVPDRESPLQLLSGIEMSPDFQCIRQLLLNLLCMYTNKNANFVATLRWCSDVLRQILNSPQHPTVKNWCADIMNVVNAQLENDEDSKLESDERINDEYLDLQDQVINGSLPCPKEEAAMMAAIQLCVEENWPSNKRTQTIRRHLLKGQFGRIRDMAQKIMVTPWEVDQNLYCTPPRVVNTNFNPQGLLTRKSSISANSSSPNPSIQQQSLNQQPFEGVNRNRRRRSLTFFTCISEPDPMMSSDIQAQCLPVDLRDDRRTIKLIRERKRKLFHSHIYESEIGMKKLYIQTAKKLPSYGCKVFQVKELLHGRTLRKTMRLLCLSSSVLCLLDGGSKLVLKRQHAVTLQQWRVGGGVSKHQLLLEFRGTKWQLIAPSYNVLKSISITLWEIMQNRASIIVQKSFNRSTRASLAFFDTNRMTAHSSRTNSYSSTSSSFRDNSFCSGEPITLFRLELERLQYILHFPEEVAFQLSTTEYQLFYSIAPIDFIRYVGCDLASIPIADNPSPVRNLVKRLSEVSSWITHVIISQPTHDDRKNCLASIIRVIDTCWNIGNFNAAVEILMGLKSNKLRPFWLSLKHEERQRYEEFVDILLPNSDSAPPHPLYLETIQKALRMPQCRVIPFFGTFLRDLYAIVNDIPNVVVIGNNGEVDKLKFLNDVNGDDHFSSNISIGGLLNTDKINLIGIILDNIETFHNHHKKLIRYVETPPLLVENPNGIITGIQQNMPLGQQPEQLEVKPYEPIQSIAGSSHGVSLIPLNSSNFDLDMIQRIQHGTTVIHYDPESGRSVLCRLVLDPSCSTVSWHRVYYGGKDGREKDFTTVVSKTSANLQSIQLSDVGKFSSQSSSCPQPRPTGSAVVALDEGFIRTSFIKAIEGVDSYDIDIEAIYRRHSMEEMSVPIICWTINFGCMLNDNEFLYFLAPQQIAQYWTTGLQKVVKCIQDQNQNPDRRVMWLKKLYLQLYNESERDEFKRLIGPRPVEALQSFGGRVEKWKNLGVNQTIPSNPRLTESSSSTEGGYKQSRFKQMTIAVTRRVKGASRDCSRSQSPQPQSPLVRPPSIRSQLSSQSGPPGPNSPGYLLKPRSGNVGGGGGGMSISGAGGCDNIALSDAGDLDSLYTPRSRTPTSSSYGGRSVGGRSIKSWRSRGGETPNSGSISSSGQVSGLHGLSGKEYQEKPVSFAEFLELFRLFSTRMRKDLKDLFNDCLLHSNINSHVSKRGADREKASPRLQSRLGSLSGPPLSSSEFIPDDALTRNTAAHLCHLNDKQQKIYNALALASVSSAGFMDTSRNTALNVAAMKHFFCTQQMEQVDEQYIHKLIQEHEPDATFRGKQLLSFEGFVRYLSDPSNFAFVPEEIQVPSEQLQYPLSYYYISCSHNTYLTGHQLKGESSAEMYRQVLQTGCRCVELDCWDGDDGLPLIYHGHTFTTKISFRQVVDIIKKSAFETSNLPIILSIENHCSLQQQAKMAQMFKTAFGDKLVTSFLFDCDYSDNPRLPTPWQLRNRILIKNKKMTMEPSIGLYYADKMSNIGDANDNLYRKQSRSSYDSSTIDGVDEDDLDEFLDEEDSETDDVDDRTDGESPTKGVPIIKRSSSRRRSSKDSINSFVSDRTNSTRQAQKTLDLKCGAGDDDAFCNSGTNVVISGGISPGAVSSVIGVNSPSPCHIVVEATSNVAGAVTNASCASGGIYTPRRAQVAISRLPTTGHQIAPELSDLVIYARAVKFKGFALNNIEQPATPSLLSNVVPISNIDNVDHRSFSNSFATPKMRSQASSLLSSGPPPRRQKSSSQISTTDSVKSVDDTSTLTPVASNTCSTTNNYVSVVAAATAVTANISSNQPHSPSPSAAANNNSRGVPNACASCYQVSSLTEASARKLCRKHPQKCIAYTQNHIMRTYPGGMRIDSSNFNPHRLVEFWQCGLQMVALNYQTPDVAMHINTAMFEQSGNCGYMLKPRALWDPIHPMFGKFNPMAKDISSSSALILQLTVISGQYVCPGVFTASPFLEIEIIGIPADCAKEKSKIIGRNSVNPIWNHSTTFRINFVGLAFLRIAVCDGAANGRVLSQRAVPIRCLRPGYRHLPLRSASNQPLEQSTLFLRTRFEQEEHIYLHDENIFTNASKGPPAVSAGTVYNNHEPELAYQILKIDPDTHIRPLSILRRQIFILCIVGLYPDDMPTIVHAESASTVRHVIQTALTNAGKVSESSDDYTLYEESVPCMNPLSIGDSASLLAYNTGSTGGTSSAAGADLCETSSNIITTSTLDSPSQKIGSLNTISFKGRELPHNEPIMDAVACWNGSTRRFYLRKRSTDPTSRTWITSIIKSSGTNTMISGMGGGSSGGNTSTTVNISSASFTSNPTQSTLGLQLRRSIMQQQNNSTALGALETCATPKSHSSTQLHGHSLDVETGTGCDYLDPTGIHPRAKSMGETFLVCIHNVSDCHSYAILRTSIDTTTKDIIKQVFAKTQRYDINESDYVLIEELRETVACVSEPTTTRHFGGKISVDSLAASINISPRSKAIPAYRILDPDENIWKTQSQWQTPGRFLLERRDQLSKFEKASHRLLDTTSDSNQSLSIINPTSSGSGTLSTSNVVASVLRDTPRKISLSNVRSIGLSRRFSRFGKSLTLDAGKGGNVKET